MHLIIFKNRRLNKADFALNHSKYQKAFIHALPLVNSRNKEIAFRSNRICGLALYKQKKYEDSIKYMEKACQVGNYRHDWYNLSMAFVFAGKPEKADEAFKNIYRTNLQPGYMYAVPVPGLLFQYLKALILKKFNDAAMVRANELRQMYIGVGKDINKQVQRGLPSYPMFLNEVKLLLEPEKFKEWENNFNPSNQ